MHLTLLLSSLTLIMHARVSEVTENCRANNRIAHFFVQMGVKEGKRIFLRALNLHLNCDSGQK